MGESFPVSLRFLILKETAWPHRRSFVFRKESAKGSLEKTREPFELFYRFRQNIPYSLVK
jgi:hypothetical protein